MVSTNSFLTISSDLTITWRFIYQNIWHGSVLCMGGGPSHLSASLGSFSVCQIIRKWVGIVVINSTIYQLMQFCEQDNWKKPLRQPLLSQRICRVFSSRMNAPQLSRTVMPSSKNLLTLMCGILCLLTFPSLSIWLLFNPPRTRMSTWQMFHLRRRRTRPFVCI